MNAIQQFAQKYGKVTGKELDRKYDDIASEFSKSVKSVLDEGGEFNVDDTLNEGTSQDFNVWQAILTGVDEHLIPMNHSLILVLNTDLKNGSSRLECHYYDDDANLLSKFDGEPGNFNPIPVITECIAQYWDKRRSNKKTKPRKKESVMNKCSMQKKKESLSKKNEDASLKQVCDAALKDSGFEDDYWAWTRSEADKIADKITDKHPELDYDEVWEYVRESMIGYIYDNCNPV